MLFDNNDSKGFDYSFLDLAGLTNNMNSNELNLYTSKEGFLRGNMFKDEYIPYKNYSYVNIGPKSEREAKLFNVMQYEFAIGDLNLFLDLNPNNEYALNILKELIRLEKEAKSEYEKEYGPLEVCDTKSSNFEWIKDPWPWEKEDGGSMYV